MLLGKQIFLQTVGSVFSCPILSYVGQSPVQMQVFGDPAAPISAGQGNLRSLSLNENGSILASGVPNYSTAPAGRVNIFNRSGSTFSLTQVITNPFSSPSTTHQFGYATSLSYDGVYLAIGAYGYTGAGTDGRVAIYKWNGSSYVKIQDFGGSVSGAFGIDLALSGDGSVLVVGSRTTDSAFVFYNVADVYTEIAQLQPSEASGSQYGVSVDVSGDGNHIVVGDKNNNTSGAACGVVYVYYRDAGGLDNWGEQQVLHAAGSWASIGWKFGSDVALSCDGTYLAIGCEGVNRTTGSAPGGLNEGSMEIWSRVGSSWSLRGAVSQFNDTFTSGSGLCGESVAITSDGIYAYMGGSQGDHGITDSGIIEQAVWGGASYTPAVTVPSSPTRVTNDHFGKCIALSRDGKHLVVGSKDQDSIASNAGNLYYFAVGTQS